MNKIGHNNPPDALQSLNALHAGLSEEIRNWLDGERITTDGQLVAVDELIARAKAVSKEYEAGKEAEFRPVKNELDAIQAKWKAPLDEWQKDIKGLNAIAEPYKLAKKRALEEAQRQAREEAERIEREAKEALAKADMADMAQRQEVDELEAQAREKQREAQALAKEKITGVRKKSEAIIADGRALINWIATNDKTALTAFMESYVASKRTLAEKSALPGVEIKETEIVA